MNKNLAQISTTYFSLHYNSGSMHVFYIVFWNKKVVVIIHHATYFPDFFRDTVQIHKQKCTSTLQFCWHNVFFSLDKSIQKQKLKTSMLTLDAFFCFFTWENISFFTFQWFQSECNFKKLVIFQMVFKVHGKICSINKFFGGEKFIFLSGLCKNWRIGFEIRNFL